MSASALPGETKSDDPINQFVIDIFGDPFLHAESK